MSHFSSQNTLPNRFSAQASDSQFPGRRYCSPFYLRLSEEERARIEIAAGGKPLGTYIRSELLGEHVARPRIAARPTLNNVKIAQVLAGLGQSRLASNMNQIAKAANIGGIDVSPELIRDMEFACQNIREMRDALIEALGLKVEIAE